LLSVEISLEWSHKWYVNLVSYFLRL